VEIGAHERAGRAQRPCEVRAEQMVMNRPLRDGTNRISMRLLMTAISHRGAAAVIR
jgi:hypothetical protein